MKTIEDEIRTMDFRVETDSWGNLFGAGYVSANDYFVLNKNLVCIPL